jgi:hypothetical protein
LLSGIVPVVRVRGSVVDVAAVRAGAVVDVVAGRVVVVVAGARVVVVA